MTDNNQGKAAWRSGYNQRPVQQAANLPSLPSLLTENGKLNAELFKEELLTQIAKAIQNVSKSQMRKVFDEVKRHKFALEAGQKWEDIYPQVLMQKAKISYLCKRKSEDNKIDESYYNNLKKLIFQLADDCRSAESYKAYATFLEALYGYYYEIARRK